jgi:basic membrane protein A
MVKRMLSLALTALVVALALGAAACGSDDDDDASDGAKSDQSSIKVGLVADGPLDDRGFNFLANEGRKDAESKYGVESRVVVSRSTADYLPNLSSFAQQGYDLVIGVGFEMADAVNTVAKKFPDTKFAIIDYPATALKDKPANVEGLIYNEQEGGYLAGYVAGLYAKDEGAKAVSSVGGEKIPPVDNYIAGFQAGAKAAYPAVETLNGYSQDFVDPAKCKEIALDQISRGSVAVIQLAGGCGLGALDAAKQEGVQGIGESADQAYLGDHILTSALKRVDVSVLDTVKRVIDGSFQGGTDVLGSVENGAIGLGTFNAVGKKYEDEVRKLEEKFSSGQVPDIPDTVG